MRNVRNTLSACAAVIGALLISGPASSEESGPASAIPPSVEWQSNKAALVSNRGAQSSSQLAGIAAGYGTLQPLSTWLEVLNLYRAASWLPLTESDPSLVRGIEKHLEYLDLTPASYRTGFYANPHRQNPLSPWYSREGSISGNSSNLAFGTTNQKQAMEKWIHMPLHMIGMLRRGLFYAGFATRFSPPNSSFAALDVFGGLYPTYPDRAVVFPGEGMTLPTNYFAGETPDPLEQCGYRAPSGVPLIAMLPFDPPLGTTSTLQLGYGDLLDTADEICTVTAATWRSSDVTYGPLGKSILQREKAVLIFAKNSIGSGTHQATINLPGYGTLSWTFTFGFETSASPPMVYPGDDPVVIETDPDATVVGTITAPDPRGEGFATLYPCESGPTNTSNLNFSGIGRTVANFFVTRADSEGKVCVHVSAPTHLLVDRVSEVGIDNSTEVLSEARRLLDSRGTAKPLAGSTLKVRVGNPGRAVVGTITAVDPQPENFATAQGYVTAYPCLAGRTETSNLNFSYSTIAAGFISQVDANGDVCFYLSKSVHLLVDVVASLDGGGLHPAIRDLDTRRSNRPVEALETIEVLSGFPNQTIVGTVTALQATFEAYLTVFECGTPRPETSNLNFGQGRVVANAFVVKIGSSGKLCVFASDRAHVLVDRVGELVSSNVHPAIRDLDTRQPPTRFRGPRVL